jgi:intracellular sulfur oxidation DsrE/DsrF family protein
MMDNDSNQLLDAYVDGELTGAELELALRRLETDPEFRRGVCELRTLKEMVHSAYSLDEAVAQPGRRQSQPVWRQALAAGLLLAMGLGGGWFMRGEVADPLAGYPLASLGSGQQISALVNQMEAPKILLHLDSNDIKRTRAALDNAERLVQYNARAQVEVLVNSHGLNLVRADTSPDGARIDHLMNAYPNLRFVACAQTMTRFRNEGMDVRLLPEVGVVNNALAELTERMQHGWVYVHA